MVKLPAKVKGFNLLKGSTLPFDTDLVTIKKFTLRTDLRSPWLDLNGTKYSPTVTLEHPKLDGENIPNELGLNKTNTQSLEDWFGVETDAWIGKKIRLLKVKANNPQTGQLTDSIAMAKA